MTSPAFRKWIPALALVGLLAAGCETKSPLSDNEAKPGGKLVAAQLDTLPLLQHDPEYQKLSQSYIQENVELRKKIQHQVDKGEISKEQAMPTYIKAQKQLNDRWLKQTNNFIEGSHSRIRDAVKQLCEEKGLDIVLIHSRAYPTVAWGALDITQDVGMKIYGNPIEGTATPGGTPK